MSASHRIGSWSEEGGSRGGWFVGSFMEAAPQKTEALEAKFWKFAAGNTGHAPKTQRVATELTLVLKGKVRGFVGEERIELSAGQYIVIAPGTPNNIVEEAVEDAEGICIKSPSIPEDIQR